VLVDPQITNNVAEILNRMVQGNKLFIDDENMMVAGVLYPLSLRAYVLPYITLDIPATTNWHSCWVMRKKYLGIDKKGTK